MAVTKTIIIKADTSNAVSGLNKLEKGLDKTGDQAKQTSAEMSTLTGGAGARFKGLITGIKSVASGFKSLKFAIAASGIGLLLIALVSIKAAFESSEEGQNKFAKLMGVIGSITGNFIDLLAKLGEKIISIFENPKQAIKDFVKLLKENVINRFKGILELIPQLSKAVGQLFKGDFSGAAETAGNAVAKVTLGVDNLSDSIRGAAKELQRFSKEVADDAKKAAEIADKRAKADKIERKLIVERAEANKRIAELRFKSEQRDKFAASERVAFLKEASKISEDITNKEIAANKLRLDAKIEENKLNKSNKDDLNEVAQLQAKAIQLNTSKLNLQKRLQTSITTFSNEEKALIKAGITAREKETEGLNKIFVKRKDDSIQLLLTENEEKLQIQKDANLATFNEDLKLQSQIQDNKDETAEYEKALDKAVANAKLNIAGNTAGLISQLVEKDSALGKGVAVAQATISGFQGVQSAFTTASASPITTLFPAYPFIQAGLAGAFSAVQIKNILKTDPKTGKGGGGHSGGGGGASAPAFNLVAGSGSNQIAEGLAKQDTTVKAYVVSSDVSSGQSLDRNIVENSSL